MENIVLSQEAVKSLATTVKQVMGLMAEIEAANEDIGELCKQLKDSVDIPPAETKKIAKVLYKNSLEDERSKFETLEEMVAILEGKV